VQLLDENAELRKERAVDKKRIDEAHAEISALRLAMQVSNQEATEDLARHKIESAAAIKAAVIASDAKIDGLRIELDDLEQYGRRKSIRVQNVPIVNGEDKDKSQDLLLQSMNATLKPAKIVLKHEDIIRFHRSSAAKDDRNTKGGKVSQCIVKMRNWRLRQQFQGLNAIMRKREDEEGIVGCRVYHDLTKRRLSLLNEARALCKDGWFAYADANSNLKLRKGERFLKFNTSDELEKHMISLGFVAAAASETELEVATGSTSSPCAVKKVTFADPEGVSDISDISDIHVPEHL
jgi:hypothetical protein